MKHFSDEDWLDFVRDVMPVSRRSTLEEHLQRDCSECVHRRNFWEFVLNVARRQSNSEVPSEVAEAAESMFAPWRRRLVLATRARPARPIFDSLLAPLPVGVRAAGAAPRRVMHRWGRCTVDLRIESEAGSRLTVIGQMLCSGSRPTEGSLAHVFLIRADEVIDESDASPFGEFQFTCDQAPELKIVIDPPGKAPISVVLPAGDEPLAVRKKVPSRKEGRNEPR